MAARRRETLGVISSVAVAFACLVSSAGAVAAPPNDAFASAQAISGASGTVTGTTTAATKETGEPSIAGNAGGASIWFTWTAPAAGAATIDTTGSSFDTLLGVYTGSSVSTLSLVAGNDDISGSVYQSRVTFTATAGTTYKITVDGYHSNAHGTTATGSVQLNWSTAGSPPPPPPTGPPNDAFASAQAISGASGTVTGTTTAATKETGEPSIAGNAGGASIWFTWTAPAAGAATIDTTGSSFDTLLGVYTGSSVSTLSLVAGNDDISGSVYQSRVTFTATAGTTYKITVDGYHSNAHGTTATGSVQLNWSTAGSPPPPPPTGPPNDAFASAQAISGASGTVTGTTTAATKETGEPSIAGNAGGASIWFTWTAPAAGAATIDTTGSSFDTLLGVYTGSSVSTLSLVAGNDDISGSVYQSRVTFTATAGTTYKITVDGYHSNAHGTTATGSVQLNWSTAGSPPPPPPTGPPGDQFASPIAVSGSSGSVAATTAGATKEAGEPDHATNAGGHSIWFQWTAPSGGTATFSTAGSGFDTTLAVYTGTAVNALSWVSSNDDAGSGISTSSLTIVATAGTTYSIAVDGWAGANGSVALSWSTGPEAAVASGDPLLVVAGDIHANCSTSQAEQTARVVDQSGAAAIFADGDLTDTGSDYQMRNCFGSTWGRFAARLHTAVGNHEYGQANAGPYFGYFGAAAGNAGQGWYSFDLGTWHVIALNSNCSQIGGCGPGSAEVTWLQQDLAAHPAACTIALFHHPLFTSYSNGLDGSPATLWQTLYGAGADLIVNAHSRDYERFAPQTPAGVADPANGIREFIVGTGGVTLDPARTAAAPNSEAYSQTTLGVLGLTLHPGGYDWNFMPVSGGAFTDAGSGTCH